MKKRNDINEINERAAELGLSFMPHGIPRLIKTGADGSETVVFQAKTYFLEIAAYLIGAKDALSNKVSAPGNENQRSS